MCWVLVLYRRRYHLLDWGRSFRPESRRVCRLNASRWCEDSWRRAGTRLPCRWIQRSSCDSAPKIKIRISLLSSTYAVILQWQAMTKQTNKQTNKPIQQQLIMHPTPFQLWWRHIKTNITNNSGNYNITDLSLYKDRMTKDRFVNSYTTRGTSKECPRGRSAIWVPAGTPSAPRSTS